MRSKSGTAAVLGSSPRSLSKGWFVNAFAAAVLARVVPGCSLFRPELYWWRLLLTLRKLCIVSVALMFSSTPLFQAWYVWCAGAHFP